MLDAGESSESISEPKGQPVSGLKQSNLLEQSSVNRAIFFTVSLVVLHGQFNTRHHTSKPTRNHLNKLTSLYDLSLFNLDSNLDVNINPLMNLSNLQIRSRYFSPHSFVQTISKISQNVLASSFCIF